MKTPGPVALAAFLFLTAGVWSHSAQAQQVQNPACGQQVLLKRGPSSLQATDNLRFNLNNMGGIGSCATPVSAIHLVLSPSGLADTTATGDFPGLFVAVVEPGTTSPISPQEYWATAGSGVFDAPEFSEQHLECDDPLFSHDFNSIFYIELEHDQGFMFFHPTVAGGAVTFSAKFCDEPFDQTGTYCYGGFLTLQGRTTDRDGDGDTDEDDENSLRADNGIGSDLSWNGTVDATDLAILLREANRRINGQPYKRGQCANRTDHTPFTYVGPYHQYPPGTITNLSATAGGGGSIQLQWTAPGDDGSVRTASQYDLRWSNACITESNFYDATPIATSPPQVAGSTESVTFQGQASTKYYFAIKTVDDQGNWSAVSNSSTNSNVAPPALTMSAGFGKTTTTTTFTLPANAGCTLAWEVRVASTPINTQAKWDAAVTLATGSDGNGTMHCIQQSSLPSCTSYYFAGRYTDSGVLSPLSNSPGGKTRCSGTIEVDCGGSFSARPERSEDAAAAAQVELFVRGANPAKSEVGLEYVVPSSYVGAPMRLAIFDVSGRLVRSLESGDAQAGQHEASWNLLDDAGLPAARGLYFARIVIGPEIRTRTIFVNR